MADGFPFIGVAVWSAILLTIPVRRHDWEVLPETVQGSIFFAVAGDVRVDDAGGATAARLVDDCLGAGLYLGDFDNIRSPRWRSSKAATTGAFGLRRWLWRLDAVVWFVLWRGADQYVPRKAAPPGNGCATAGMCRWAMWPALPCCCSPWAGIRMRRMASRKPRRQQ